MDALGPGSVIDEGPNAPGEGAGDAERVGEAHRVEVEDLRRRRSRREAAHDAGAVPAAISHAGEPPERLQESVTDVVAGDRGSDEVAAARADALPDRDGRRKHRRPRMTRAAAIDEVPRVRRGAIREGRI